MSSSFPFVPRVVSKTKRKSTHTVSELAEAQRPTLAPNPHAHTAASSSTTRSVDHKSKHKANLSNEDYTSLLSLALSDYALWNDPVLRRKLEWSSSDSYQEGGHGYFPLSYLLNHSKVLAPLELGQLQGPMAKALRSDAVNMFELRLLITDPSPSAWLIGQDELEDSEDVGAYEICRKNWKDHPSRNFTKADWDNRSIYVERLPIKYRTVPAISRFISALLAERLSSINPLTRIQGIIFPPHHMDKPDDFPACRGFALVVLGDAEDVEFLLKRWPWNGQQQDASNDTVTLGAQEGTKLTEAREANQFGFRTLSKLGWDQLKTEYLSYRSQLVSEINAYEDANRPILIPPEIPVPLEDEDSDSCQEPNATPVLDYSSPYPFNCLVFVRNIHTETNKTTLRKLFATAFRSALANGEMNSDGVDYVDFIKGMDSCHVRLATQKHAEVIVQHFDQHPTLQTSGLDETGAVVEGKSMPAMTLEVVTGRREELYWEKVPEKVRRQAVQKAIDSMKSLSQPNVVSKSTINYIGNAERRQGKRQKR